MEEHSLPESSNIAISEENNKHEENKSTTSSTETEVPTPSQFISPCTPQRSIMRIQSPSLVMRQSQTPIVTQPRFSNLPSPRSVIENQPQPLFVQALLKLNENNVIINFKSGTVHLNRNSDNLTTNFTNNSYKTGDITPPDSLTSAPPSYSFVLRQMAARRRPRLMGTFIPSPSFIQHTPPPNYANAFDIYVEPILPAAPRVYNFGFTPLPVVCPECGFTGLTVITAKITICTHMCAFLLCLFCCWICAPLPYLLKSCKDVYHHCRNCRYYLGMYCPTNPDNAYLHP